jgi:hypothetical protein
MFSLKFDHAEIPYWAGRYSVEEDHEIETSIVPQVHLRGYFTHPEFLTTCHWKTPRSKRLVESNPEGFIKEVTRTALSTPDERLRIEVLTLLKGVSWPTASVILHFGYLNQYPVLDFRTLWSLGIEYPPIVYDFDFWRKYTLFCRQCANDNKITLRTLDRALWQFSKENQG